MFKEMSVMAAAVLVVGSLEGLETQERPDFSGTWVVELVEFQGPQGNAGGGRRGGGGGRGQDGRAGRGGRGRRAIVGPPYQEGDRVTFRQTDETLIVTDETRSRMSSYPLDGRETGNPGPGETTIMSRASWDGAALVIESTLSVASPRGDMTVSAREARSLSPDGRTVTLVATAKTPFGDLLSTVTLVRADQAR